MTREEFDEEVQSLRSNVGGYGNTKSSLRDIVYYVDELEQRIAELEQQNKALIEMVEMQSKKIKELEAPKTCDGCKWLDYANSRHIGGCSKINSCVRQPMISDYYEPKQ